MVGAVIMESSGDDGGTGGAGGGSSRQRPSHVSSWLSAKAWDQLLAYEGTLGPPFAGLCDSVEEQPKVWKVKERINLLQNTYHTSIGPVMSIIDISRCISFPPSTLCWFPWPGFFFRLVYCFGESRLHTLESDNLYLVCSFCFSTHKAVFEKRATVAL